MNIRLSENKDIPQIMKIYTLAKEHMDKSGNPNQWLDGYPKQELVEDDVRDKISYVILNDEKEIVGVFAFIIGEDATYIDIREGNWLNEELYGTVHRLASNGKARGIFKQCFNFCKEKIQNIRCDTHYNNGIMQKHFIDYGFQTCGIITADDGNPRIAYQYINKDFIDKNYPVINGVYKHFKGNSYEVLFLSKHSETEEDLVNYRRVGQEQIWTRPLSMWNEKVNGVPRFALQTTNI